MTATPTTGAIVLAAGFSKRFGSTKLCARLPGGKTVCQQTVERIQAAVPEVLVITRPELASLLSGVGAPLRLFTEAQQGMGATLAFAAGQIDRWDAVLVCLADMPFVATATYRRLASQVTRHHIVVPTCESRPGNPIAFGCRYFEELSRLSGDSGGRRILEAHPLAVRRVETGDPGILADIDTPLDLKRQEPPPD